MSRDAQDLLCLYEATYLRVHGEDILEEALEFTKTKLKELVPHLAPSLAKQVLHALSRPMRKALPRMYAREFMSFYQEDEFHDEVLLKFAKFDFNILQRQHQQELSIVSRYTTSSIDLTERIMSLLPKFITLIIFFLRPLVITLVFRVYNCIILKHVSVAFCKKGELIVKKHVTLKEFILTCIIKLAFFLFVQ